MATVFPDALPDIKAWLKTATGLGKLNGGRVFFVIPSVDPKSPFMRLYLTGGAAQPNSEAPLMTLHVTIEGWATTRSQYNAVRTLMVALQSQMHQLPPGTKVGSTVVHNAAVGTVMDQPDPDTGWPRIIANTTWTVSL